jgi:predicted Zn-dependent protease
MAQRKKPKERKRKSVTRPILLDFQLRRKLEEVEEYIEEEDFGEARRVLVELRQRAPNHPAVLENLSHVYFELKEWHAYLEIAERLRERTPERADLYLSLASAYVRAGLLFSASRTLQDFLARFPRSEHVARARDDLARIRKLCGDLLADLRTADGFALWGEAAERFLVRHERIQILLPAGRFAEALELAQSLEKEAPDWPPLCNNLGLLLGMLGRNEEALSCAERTLAKQPDNAFALAERVRRLYLLGRTEDLARAAEEAALRTRDSTRDDADIKLAEAMALLGDDRGVLDAYRSAEAKNRPVDPAHRAFLLCLAGTAELRLGSESAARKLWEEAQEEMPAFDLAQQYLADLEQPLEERHIPWYLSARSVMPSDWMDAYIAETRQRKNPDALRARTRLFLEERPALKALLPALFDRGDPPGRVFALTLCRLAETPECLEMLRDFALGQRGPDALRHGAMTVVKEAGLLQKGSIQMWVQGEWTEVVPLAFEITEEPLRERPEALYALVRQAHEALTRNDLPVAEQALAAALREDPDSPDLLNNLAVVRERQGRKKEALAIEADLRKRFPDYSFAIMAVANHELARGNPKEAFKLLLPILRRDRLHISEFVALCGVEIRALLASGELTGARRWFEMLRAQAPHHPTIPDLRRLLNTYEGDLETPISAAPFGL